MITMQDVNRFLSEAHLLSEVRHHKANLADPEKFKEGSLTVGRSGQISSRHVDGEALASVRETLLAGLTRREAEIQERIRDIGVDPATVDGSLWGLS